MMMGLRQILSLMLLLALALTNLSSCFSHDKMDTEADVKGDAGKNDNTDKVGVHPKWNFYPEGYTAGFPRMINKPAPRLEFWWVETYEEALVAIELLRSHGSTFANSAVFTHDGELFDTKYCFKICLEQKDTEEIKFGDNPFDRCAKNVEITSYAFFDDVTIDEINRSDVLDYEVYVINPSLQRLNEPPVMDEDNVTYYRNEGSGQLLIYDNQKRLIFMVNSFGYYENPEKAKEYIKAVFDTLVFIGFND